MIKGSVQEGDIILINICVTNTGAPKYIKQTLTDRKGEIDRNTITVRLQHPTDIKGQIIQTENQQGNRGPK